ncbi:MAG: hypothetical protein IJY53_01500, partial [Akkermansia sp.]|nr:hypothetical protein [Akkermansia sp.]
QPFISRAGIIFIPTTYYHNSWWLAHLSPSFRDFFDAVPKKIVNYLFGLLNVESITNYYTYPSKKD